MDYTILAEQHYLGTREWHGRVIWLEHWLGQAALLGLLFGRATTMIMIEPSDDGRHMTS